MPDESKSDRQLRALRIYVVVSTSVIGLLALTAFRRAGAPTKFDEIDVQRINIREPDGKLRMVLSNKVRSTGPIAYGKPFGYPGGSRPGIIFFNDEETEDGGLVFEGKTEKGQYAAAAQLSFDQYDHDQVVVLNYNDDKGRRSMGLTFADRSGPPIQAQGSAMDSLQRMPNGPAKDSATRRLFGPIDGVPQYAPRLFVGRRPNRDAQVGLSDRMGRPRLLLVVDSLGAARIDFLNDSGRVTKSIVP